MDDIDYGQFMTPRPPAFSGRKAMYDTFAALAKARRDRALAEMEDAQRRDASALSYDSSMFGHKVSRQNAVEAEEGRAVGRDETHRANVAKEGNAAATLEQKKQEHMSKLMLDKDFRSALSSGDPNALAPWMPGMQANGITVADVMDPGTNFQEGDAPGPLDATGITELDEPVDAVSGPAPVAQAPAPTGRKSISGPAGLNFMFDAPTNAFNRAKTAARLQEGMTAAAGEMGPQAGEGTRDASALAKSYVVAGMDPVKAAETAGQQSVALAGQASGRRNADVAGARGATRGEQGAERLELSKGTYAWDKASKLLGQFKFSEAQAQNQKFNGMARQLAAAPNAALDAAIAGRWVKEAQGGTGVLSDSDMRQFWEKIGGMGMKVEGAIQGLIDGTIPADKRAAVLVAVKELAATAAANMDRVRGVLRTAMDNDPNITPEMRKAVLTTYGAMPSKAETAIQGLVNKYAGGK